MENNDNIIETHYSYFGYDNELDEMFRKAEIRLIKKILTFLNGPKVEKEFAVKAIEQLTKI